MAAIVAGYIMIAVAVIILIIIIWCLYHASTNDIVCCAPSSVALPIISAIIFVSWGAYIMHSEYKKNAPGDEIVEEYIKVKPKHPAHTHGNSWSYSR
jgi:hypothetical protein